MKKNKQITVDDAKININKEDYISLTDMVRDRQGEDHIRNWMRNRNTIEFLGIWEQLHNNDTFKPAGFEGFKKEVGLNSFVISPKKWIEETNAIGITSTSGRYGGTYAHKDIAFEFASWISPKFKLILITQLQRLEEIANNENNQDWSLRRLISKSNYPLQTEAVKNYIIPKSMLPKNKQGIEYAKEADILNIAVFGCTAKDWKQKNSKKSADNENIRDSATINELIVLSTLEGINSNLIKKGLEIGVRFQYLSEMAKDQLSILNRISDDKKSLQKINESVYIKNKQDSDFDKSLKQAINHKPKN